MQAPAIQPPSSKAPTGRSVQFAALLVGFSIGGLFDGILLHQILQWHHLLSAVRRPWLADLRVQVLADGIFDLSMWLLLALGLVAAWRARAALARVRAACVISRALIGFGLWHLVDAVVDHWLLRIHHIRDGSAYELASDLGWLIVFGLLPAALAMWIARRGRGGGGGTGRLARRGAPQADANARQTRTSSGRAAFAWLRAVAVVLAFVAARAPRGDTALLVALPGASPADVVDRLAELDARVVWADRSGAVWSVHVPARDGRDWPMHGRVLVLRGSVVPGGCAL